MSSTLPGVHRCRHSAFVSCRHAESAQEGRRWEEWLNQGLEHHMVPPDLTGTPNWRVEKICDSLQPIVHNEDELPPNGDLSARIRAVLKASDHFIALRRPRSALGPGVRKEVREFKELDLNDRIIAGEPKADHPGKAPEGIMRDEKCICEEVRSGAIAFGEFKFHLN